MEVIFRPWWMGKSDRDRVIHTPGNVICASTKNEYAPISSRFPGTTTCDHPGSAQSSHEPDIAFSLTTNRPFAHTFMSHTYSSSSSSSNFQLIFNNALRVYQKRTKNDLLAHPLAAQLQACQSPSAILVILQQQVQHLNQSRKSDDRWTKWLDPTVNVLYAFSATLGEGVGLVCLRT